MTHPQQPPQDDAAEREWSLQEQALRAERLGLDPRGDDALLRYRMVMRALRQPLHDNLPADFAAHVAAQVRRTNTADMRLELWLSGSLLGLLIAMLIGLAIAFGNAWLPWVSALTQAPELHNPWLLTLAACITVPALLSRWSPHRTTRRLG